MSWDLLSKTLDGSLHQYVTTADFDAINQNSALAFCRKRWKTFNQNVLLNTGASSKATGRESCSVRMSAWLRNVLADKGLRLVEQIDKARIYAEVWRDVSSWSDAVRRARGASLLENGSYFL